LSSLRNNLRWKKSSLPHRNFAGFIHFCLKSLANVMNKTHKVYKHFRHCLFMWSWVENWKFCCRIQQKQRMFPLLILFG
jgi:hypothetical protein